MLYQLQTLTGNTEAVIDDNCGISKFHAIINTLCSELKVNFINQSDNAESVDWNFKYKDGMLTLHFNIFNGISIFPERSIINGDRLVLEVAEFLEKRVY
jgi:hypothetical protein